MADDRSVAPREEQGREDIDVPEFRPILFGQVEVLERDATLVLVRRPVLVGIGQLQDPVGVQSDDREPLITEIPVELLEHRRDLDAGRAVREPHVDEGRIVHQVAERRVPAEEPLSRDLRKRASLPAGEAPVHGDREPLVGADHLLVDGDEVAVTVADQELGDPGVRFHDPQHDVGRLLAVERELPRNLRQGRQPSFAALELENEQRGPEEDVVEPSERPLFVGGLEPLHERRKQEPLPGLQRVPDVFKDAPFGVLCLGSSRGRGPDEENEGKEEEAHRRILVLSRRTHPGMPAAPSGG